jgi:hypothetical protein
MGGNGQQQMLTQQAMGQQQGGGLQGLLSNPNFAQGLAQVLMSRGTYGGARGKGFADQNAFDQQMRQRQMESLDQSERGWKGIELDEKQMANENANQQMSRMSQLIPLANTLGVSIEEAASMVGVPLDEKQLAVSKSIDASLEKRRQQSTLYVDLDTGELSQLGDENNERVISLDAEKARKISADIKKRKVSNFYMNKTGGVVSDAEAKYISNMSRKKPEELGLTPITADQLITINKDKAAANKPAGLSEQKDADILSEGAKKLGKNVAQLTPSERANIRKQYDIELSQSRYSGWEVPYYDASGKLTGFINKQNNTSRPIPEGMSGAYGTGGSPSVPQTTMERLEGIRTALELTTDVMPKLTKKATFGPVAGRIKLAEINKLGGLGASKEDIDLANQLYRIVTTQAFANGGKQLTPTELAVFEKLNPILSDTLDKALIQTKNSVDFLNIRYRNIWDTMTARQQELVPNYNPKNKKQGESTGATGSKIKIISVEDVK